MTEFLGELVGTALLILLGDGVVANVVLKGTKGNNGGWIVVAAEPSPTSTPPPPTCCRSWTPG